MAWTAETRAKALAAKRAKIAGASDAPAPAPAGPRTEFQEELHSMPRPEYLGTIPADALGNPIVPKTDWSTTYVAPDGTVVNLKEPPPWAKEVLGKSRSETDGRTFVEVPDDWVLRWMSPKRIDDHGFRGWMPLMTSHPAVRLKVPQMRDAANNVRRGLNGDVLCFMPRAWYDARQQEKAERSARLARSGREMQEQFAERAHRGQFGRGVTAEAIKTPMRTQFDGRAMHAADPE